MPVTIVSEAPFGTAGARLNTVTASRKGRTSVFIEATVHVDAFFSGCQSNHGIENGAIPNGRTTNSSLNGCKETNGMKEVYSCTRIFFKKKKRV